MLVFLYTPSPPFLSLKHWPEFWGPPHQLLHPRQIPNVFFEQAFLSGFLPTTREPIISPYKWLWKTAKPHQIIPIFLRNRCWFVDDLIR